MSDKKVVDEIPCTELAAFSAASAELSKQRVAALEAQRLAVEINDVDAAHSSANRARDASIRLTAKQALMEVIGSHRVRGSVSLSAVSDPVKFIAGQSTTDNATEAGKNAKLSYKAISSRHKISYGLGYGAVMFENIQAQDLSIGDFFRINYKDDDRIAVPHIWLNFDGYSSDCGRSYGSQKRRCTIFDHTEVGFDLAVARYCEAPDIVQMTIEYEVPGVEAEPISINYKVGFAPIVESSLSNLERTYLDKLLKPFIISVLGQDQSYRVSDDWLKPYVRRQSVNSLRKALNQLNDALAATDKPISDQLMISHFASAEARYKGLGDGVVQWSMSNDAAVVRFAFSRDANGIIVEQVWLNEKQLY